MLGVAPSWAEGAPSLSFLFAVWFMLESFFLSRAPVNGCKGAKVGFGCYISVIRRSPTRVRGDGGLRRSRPYPQRSTSVAEEPGDSDREKEAYVLGADGVPYPSPPAPDATDTAPAAEETAERPPGERDARL
ncbi:hypothetical protein GCM10022630_02810 [Thermobifida alba]